MSRSVSSNSNALQASLLNIDRSEGNALNTTGFAEIRFLKDFKFSFNAGVGLDETRKTSMNNMYYGQYAPTKGLISKKHSRFFYLNLQQILEWSRKFNGLHNVSVMAGHENYQSSSVTLSASKSGLQVSDGL